MVTSRRGLSGIAKPSAWATPEGWRALANDVCGHNDPLLVELGLVIS
jgi:hypothetical protein